MTSDQEREIPPDHAKAPRPADGSMLWSAARWVSVAVVLFLGVFYLLAVLYSHSWWPWHTAKDYQPPAMYDLARTAATVTGILGAAVAVAVTLRRQRSTERTVQVAVATQQITADAYRLDVQRTGQQGIARLRDRYTTIAAQLGHDAEQVRLAGVYAMAALADDWLAESKPHEAQTCIDVLCAYLRTPRDAPTEGAVRGDLEVCQTITRVITAHLQPDAESSWSTKTFDFSGADLRGRHSFTGSVFNERCDVSFSEATFSGWAGFSDARFDEGSQVSFERATFAKDSLVSFAGSTFSGWASFGGARFDEGSQVSFERATFRAWASFGDARFDKGSQVTFYGATFAKNSEVDFLEATFSGWATFSEARFNKGSEVTFGEAVFFASSAVNFNEATFNEGSEVNFFAATFNEGSEVTFGRAMFNEGSEVNFGGAMFNEGSEVTFGWATFKEGSQVSFVGATLTQALSGPWPPNNPPGSWPPPKEEDDH